MEDIGQGELDYEDYKSLSTNRFQSLDVRVDFAGWQEITGLFDRIPIVCDHTLNGLVAEDLTGHFAKSVVPSQFHQDRRFGLSLYLTDDQHIAQLNETFRGKGQATNVLTFPAPTMEGGADEGLDTSLEEEVFLGDIAMSYETLAREAHAQRKRVGDHFTHLLIHGLLHSLGFDHESDEEAATMERIEINLLEKLRIADPYCTEELG